MQEPETDAQKPETDTAPADPCLALAYAVQELGTPGKTDKLLAAVPVPGGGFVAAGSVADDDKGQLLRFDATAKQTAALLLDDLNQQVLRGVAVDADGSFAVVGSSGTPGNWDGFFARVSADLGKSPPATIVQGKGDDTLKSVVRTAAGWLAVGSTGPKQASQPAGWVVGFDANGGKLWDKPLGQWQNDSLHAVVAVNGAVVVAAGSTPRHAGQPAPKRDGWLVWLDAQGTVLGEQLYGTAGEDEHFETLAPMLAAGVTPNGFVALGSQSSLLMLTEPYAVRVDAAGTVLWERTYASTPGDDGLRGATALPDGGFVAVGYTNWQPGKAGGAVGRLMRFDAAGAIQWSRAVDGPGSVWGNSAPVVFGPGDKGGAGFAFVGHATPSDMQALVVRTDAWGFASCLQAGKCALVQPKQCDDGNACTSDDCQDGKCVNPPHPGPCESQPCQVGDACGDGACKAVGKPKLWEVLKDFTGGTQYPMAATGDGFGGAVFALYGNSGGSSGFVKMAPDGVSTWAQLIPKTKDGLTVNLTAVARVGDGRYHAAGGAWDQNVNKPYLAYLSSTGALITEATGEAGRTAYGMAVRADYGLWLVGVDFVKNDAWLARYFDIGNLALSKTFGGATGSDHFYDVKALPLGGAVAVGATTPLGGKAGTGWILAVDDSGTPLLDKSYGDGKQPSYCGKLALVPGGYACAGLTKQKGAGLSDGWLLRTDQAGAVLVDKTYGTADGERFNDLAALPDAGFLLVGDIGDTDQLDTTDGKAWLVRTDAAGTVLWEQKSNPSPKWDNWATAWLLPDGTAMLGGFRGKNGDMDPVFARVDSWGHLSCTTAGVCPGVPFGSCKDPGGGGPCKAPGCDPAKGCALLPKPDGAACEDGQACTVQEMCLSGACAGGKDGLWESVWDKSGKHDGFFGASVLPDGSVVAAGRANYDYAGHVDGVVAKFDPAGKFLFGSIAASQAFGAAYAPSKRAYLNDVVALPNGDLLAVGAAGLPASGDVAAVYRITQDAELVYAKVMASTPPDNDAFNGVARDAAGVVYAVGTTAKNGQDAWFTVVDPTAGTAAPGSLFGEGGEDWLQDVVVAPGGGAVAVGSIVSNGNRNGLVVRAKADGTVLWQKDPGGGGSQNLYSVVPVPDGFVACGASGMGENVETNDFWCVRLDVTGKVVAQQKWGTPAYDSVTAVLPFGTGFLALGNTKTAASEIDAWLMQLNPALGMVGKQVIGSGAKSEWAYALVPAGKALVMAGFTTSKGNGQEDGWVMRLDASGNVDCKLSGACMDKPACDDQNPCTFDTCNAGGCKANNAPDDTACSDTGGICKGGVCAAPK